jgi:tetratricopeptide (TPR) repeat protein
MKMGIQHSLPALIVTALLSCGGANKPTEAGSTAESEGTLEDGEAMIEQSDFRGAASVFEGLTSRSPNDAKAFYYLGLCRKNLGNLNGAIESYQQAVSLDPKLMDAHINLGLALLDKGETDRALSELKVYLDASPEASDAHFNYALALETKGDLKEATAHYEKAASLDPEDPSPPVGQGDVARKQGNLQAALDYYEKARKIDPEMPELLFAEGETLLEMKKTKQACLAFLGLLKTTKPNLPTVIEAGKTVSGADPACALSLYRGAVEKDDTFASAHFFLANALAREKSFDEAAAHFERFLALAPDDPAAPEAKKRLDACKSKSRP